MKHIKSFEKKYDSNIRKIFTKLELFFKDIILKEHEVARWHNAEAVQIFNKINNYGLFTIEEELMFYENNGSDLYPYLREYIASKIPGSLDDELNIYEISSDDILLSKKEYELFKSTTKYNL